MPNSKKPEKDRWDLKTPLIRLVIVGRIPIWVTAIIATLVLIIWLILRLYGLPLFGLAGRWPWGF